MLVPDVTAAVEWLEQYLAASDVVLVKASRADGLERVAHALTTTGGDTATQTQTSSTGAEGSTDAR